MPRKSATWETALLPPQERHAVDFFARKIRRLRPGSNPRSWVPEASMLTTRYPSSFYGFGYIIDLDNHLLLVTLTVEKAVPAPYQQALTIR